MTTEILHFIGGKAVKGGSRSAPITDPATGKESKRVLLADKKVVETAIANSQEALQSWRSTTPLRRARVMFRFKELLTKHQDELAMLITKEHGKVLSDARAEVTRGLEVVEFSCGIPHLLKGAFSESVGTGVDSWSVQQPVGICTGIAPFNFPCMVPMWMFPVALACGNTFILKPSEKDPSVTIRIAELLMEAGLPAGVFNVVQGDKEAVDNLLEDERVEAVSFVGSTPIAQYIYSKASETGKRVQALGGAKNHLIVMPDAHLEGAVDALMGSAFGAAGERCMAISVAVAVGNVGDKLVAQLTDRVKNIKVGPGHIQDPENDMGPLVTKAHLDRVTDLVDKGVEEGAQLVVDGRGHKVTGFEGGFFLGGCLFDHVKAPMTIYQEEIFGPVLCVVRVANFEEAMTLIEANPYGNGTAIFTRDGDTARTFSNRVSVGMVGINVPIPVPMAFHSFGGWKKSIFGPLNMHGIDGVRFYTRMKTMTARWPSGLKESAEFVMPTH